MASVNRRVPTRTNYVLTTTQQPTSTKETSTANTVTGVSTSVPTPTANCKTYTANAPQTKQVTTGTPTNAPAETPSVSTTESAVKTPTSTSSVTTVSTTNAPGVSQRSSVTGSGNVSNNKLNPVFYEQIKEMMLELHEEMNELIKQKLELDQKLEKVYAEWRAVYADTDDVNRGHRTQLCQQEALKIQEEIEKLQQKYHELNDKMMSLKYEYPEYFDAVLSEVCTGVVPTFDVPTLPADLANPTGTADPTASSSAGATSGGTYIVKSGDTLWKIAKGLLPAGASDSDIQKKVNQLIRDNGIANPNLIQPGDIIEY